MPFSVTKYFKLWILAWNWYVSYLVSKKIELVDYRWRIKNSTYEHQTNNLHSLIFPIANIILLYYFALNCLYISIKQKYLFNKLSKITNSGIKNLWTKFSEISSKIQQLHSEIAEYNRFWSPHLTIYFLVYVFEVVYFTYAIFYIETDNPFAIYFNVYFGSAFLFILILATTVSEKIIVNNEMTFKQCRELCVQYKASHRATLTNCLKVRLHLYL